MKSKYTKVLSVFICFVMVFFYSSAFNRLVAGNLKAVLSYSTFSSPIDGPYIETYISIAGNSLEWKKNENGKFQSAIEITLIFKQENEIVNFDKYEVISKEIADTSNITFSIIDQQRYLLKNGSYDFKLSIADKNKEDDPYVHVEPIVLDYPDTKVVVSGIELVDSYTQSTTPGKLTKSGYDFVPYVANFYPVTVNRLSFYCEIYNTEKILGQGEKYLLAYYIKNFDTQQAIGQFIKYKRDDTKGVNVLFHQFDISKLPSGNYNLVVEAKNKNNELVGYNELFFQRSNPNIKVDFNEYLLSNFVNEFSAKITNIDTISEYLRSLEPICSEQERTLNEELIDEKNLEKMQKYFYNFWFLRNNTEPQKAWENYLTEVSRVNSAYSSKIKKGYATDRGRVYLKYGPPNTVSESYNEPSAYPYEIWHYYSLRNQRNKKFVFYSPDLTLNDFYLIHSDAIGELSNYRWQYEIHRRGVPFEDVDRNKVDEQWGSEADDFYLLPR